MPSDDILLLLYEYGPKMAEQRETYRGPHREKIAAEREAGRVIAAGPFDPPTGGMLVFKGVDREHVEAFVATDPFNQAGLIASHRIQPWMPLWESFAS
jgi:uncharacterized protein